MQKFSLDLNGLEEGSIFHQTYYKGQNDSVPIVSPASSISSSSAQTFSHMEVFFATHYDGHNETLSVNDFTHPSLVSGLSSPSFGSPSVLYFRGLAPPDTYLEALRHVNYQNRKGRPTTGSRVIAVSMYNGMTSNPLISSYINMSVAIVNTPPTLSVSGDSGSFENRFYPNQGPVAAVDPSKAYITDTDSASIESATLMLRNALDGSAEKLEVTYKSVERVSLPVIVESTNLNTPFGRLWNGTALPNIQHSVLVSDPRLVGDVDVVVDIRHSWIGDLRIELEHADRKELLVLSPGGQTCARDNLFSTTFDSDSSANVSLSKSQESPGFCQFQTQGLFMPDGNLNNFKGSLIAGEWTLHITDLELGADTGRLVSWSLVIQPEEAHLIVASPPVVPPLLVGANESLEERHYKHVEGDGRITDVAVHVHLAVPFGADHLSLPTMKLIHPDGTQFLLSDGNFPLCAYGNYTYLIFDEQANTTSNYRDYACVNFINITESGSGQVTEMPTSGTTPTSATTSPPNSSYGGSVSSGSGSGSGSGSARSESIVMEGLNLIPTSEGEENSVVELILPSTRYSYLPTLDDALDMNISVSTKFSLVDIIPPYTSFSSLRGKSPSGTWTLVISPGYRFKSTLVGWSLRIAREPNIDHRYSTADATLYLTGKDSPANYQALLRSVVYNNTLISPNFSRVRFIDTSIFDGQAFSRTAIPQSRSYLTVHHIDIDLDPLNMSTALPPNYQITFREHSPPVPIADPTSAVISDDAFSSADYTLTITLHNYSNPGEEGLRVNTSLTPDIVVMEEVVNITDEQVTLVLTITSAIPLPIHIFQNVLRTAEYYNNAEEVHGNLRLVQLAVSDQTNNSQFSSAVASTFITIQHINDLPIIILNTYLQTSPNVPNKVNYKEGERVFLANSSGVIISDNDDNYLQSLTVTITNALDGNSEILSVSSLGSSKINYTYTATNNTLIMYGNDTLTSYSSVLGAVLYENTIHTPGMPNVATRIITFVGFDGKDYGPAAITMLSFTGVNDAPYGDLNGISSEGLNTSATFTEERGPVVIINSTAMLLDADNITLSFVTARIINALDGDKEILSVMNISRTMDPFSKVVTIRQYYPDVVFNPATSTLTITGLDSVYLYQEVLKTLSYDNLADEPNPTTRLVEVVMSDGLLRSRPLYSTVEIELVNDSPFFNRSAPDFKPEIHEDISSSDNNGIRISEFAYLTSDDDINSIPGFAITGADFSNGQWEYSVNDSDWIPLPVNISLGYALALTAIPENSMRFLPNQDYNGNSTITIIAWDGTDGQPSGSFLDARSTSMIDPFSSEIKTILMTVLPINDAPVLPKITANLTTILEDEYNSSGDTVFSLLQYASDVDIPKQQNELGIAITEVQHENGIWQFSTNGGNTWEEFSDISTESALLLHSLPVEENRVRFIPNKNFNGLSSFEFLAWDLTPIVNGSTENSRVVADLSSALGLSTSSGSGSGSGMEMSLVVEPATSATPPVSVVSFTLPSGSRNINVTSADPLSGPYSINSTTAVIIIEPVNDSPVVNEEMQLMSIPEDVLIQLNHGTQVRDVIHGHYSDVDANADMGMAVVEVDNRYGTWQYTCSSPNNSSSWQNFIGDRYFGTVAPALPIPEKATLLLSTCWVRFLPQPHFTTELDNRNLPRPPTDTPYLVVYGWDNTGLTNGRAGTYGNDATYANTSTTNEYSSNTVRVVIRVLSDNDIPVLLLTNETVAEYSTTFYEDSLSVPAVGPSPVIIDHDHTRLINISITIHGSFDESPFSHLVAESTSSASGSGETLTLVNPFLGSGSGSAERSQTQLPLSALQDYVRGKDNPTELEKYCAGLHTNQTRREELLVDVTNTDLTAEVVSWCPFQIIISADLEYGTDAENVQFVKVLRTIRYNNSIQEPRGGQRSVTYIVSDGVSTSIPVNALIHVQLVNDAPILDLNDYVPDINNFVSYTEGDPPLTLVNASGLRLVDFDNNYLQSARVELREAPDADNETLSANTTGTNIQIMYTNYTLYLTGNDTIQAYAQVLTTVAYQNHYANPGHPDERERQAVFYVSDGMKESLPAVARVSFTGINNHPFVDVNGDEFGINGTFTFIEEEGAVAAASRHTSIKDEDNTTLAFVTVQILNPYDGENESLSVDQVTLQDVLERNLNNLNKVVEFTYLIPNITYNTSNSLLYITGLDTVSEYQEVLRTLTYNNLADEPNQTPRLLEFIASDGLLESPPAYATINIIETNDSPRLRAHVPIITPHILEDETDSLGWTVENIAYNIIEDDDSNHTKGIAVIAVESEIGQWQYKLNSSLPWVDIKNTTSITMALLLRASASNFIRLLPNKDANGNATLTFVAWDATDGFPDGVERVAVSKNATDPFSAESREFTVVLVPVNDAPVINTSLTIVLPSILEDDVIDRPSQGQDVSIFLPALVEDVDETQDFGVAIVGVNDSNGHWQFSTNGGSSWQDIISPQEASALVLQGQPSGQDRIRFAPSLNYNGLTSLQFKLWDLNITYPSGTGGVDTRSSPTFSVGTGTATLEIEPVNDSPVIYPGATLSPINEDVATSTDPGTLVREILRDLYEDVDEGSEIGLAVVGTDRRHGSWQYTCDRPGFTTWNEFIGGYQFGQIAPREPNDQRGTLLVDSCRIRFVPNANFNTEYDLNGNPRPASDTPYIQIRGWDRSEGTNLNYGVDTTSNPDNHTNAFSRDIVNATIRVVSVNDRPVLRFNGMLSDHVAVYTEPIPPQRVVTPVSIVDATLFSLTDADNANLTSALLSFERLDGEQETVLFDLNRTSLNYTISTPNNTNNYLVRFEPSNGDSSPIGDFQAVLQTLQYQNSAEEPNPSPRTITLLASDHLSFSNLARIELQIQLVNDPPELDLNTELNDTYNFVNYSEGQGPVDIVGPSFLLIDHDNSSLAYVTVTIMSAPDTIHEILSANTSSSNISMAYNGTRLVLSGPASVGEFMNVLATVTYNNSFSHPGNPSNSTRIIEFVVNDGLNDSVPAIVMLFFTAVNNKPILDVSGNKTGFNFETTFIEEQGPVLAVSEDTLLMDIDNETLSFIEVTIENPLDGVHERLWVDNVTEYKGSTSDPHYTVWNFRPRQYYNSSTGALIIHGLENVHEYQQVLRTLKYNNTAGEPNNQTRTLVFTVSDGISVTTGIHTTLHIVNINDSPYFNQSATLYHFTTYEDVPNEQNAGWSLEELAGSLILDDDANSISGIAITDISTSNGRWEYTINYDTTPPPTNAPTTTTPAGSSNLNNIVADMFSGVSDSADSSGSGLTLLSGSGDVTPGSGMEPTRPAPPFYFSATWYPIPNNTILSQALALRLNGSTTRIRFVPNKNFNGMIFISFVLWDATDGLPDGSITNATSTSRTDPYSLQHVTLRGTVTPVNDAPLLLNTTVNLTSIMEDDRSSEGDDVSRLITGISDIDANDTVFGVAIVSTDDSNGMWQFTTDGGLSWTNLAGISSSMAVALSSEPAGRNKIRFWPYQDYNGYSHITFVAWDLTSGNVSYQGVVDVTAADSIVGPFSQTSARAEILVEPVNDSPVLSPGASLLTINENIPVVDNNGTLVSTILQGRYRDVDANAEAGVAVIGVDERFGQWQYRCFAQHTQWQDFIGDIVYGIIVPKLPLPERATLLAADDCSIRFLPDAYFNTEHYRNGSLRPASDTPYILARGWDNTGLTHGFSGRYGVDSSYNNDSITNEFSAETQTVLVSVTSINNLPVLHISSEGDGQFYSVLFTEGDPYVRIVEPAAVTLTDIDNTTMQSVRVEIANPVDQGQERIDLVLLPNSSNVAINRTTNIVTLTNGSRTEQLQLIYDIYNGTGGPQTSSLMFSAPSGAAKVSIQAYEALLPYLVYMNDHPEPGNVTRLIHFYVNDGSSINTPVTTTITYRLLAENHPVLTTYLYEFNFTEGDPSPVPLVAPNLTLTDEDHNEFFFMTSFTITVHPIPPSDAERVAVDLSGTPPEFNITQSYNASTGTLQVTGSAPVSVYEALLRTAKYVNVEEEPEPGPRFISLLVTDSHGLVSNTETVTVNVSVINDQVPVLSTSSQPFNYTEHLVNTSPMPISISENATITDGDGGGLLISNVTVSLINPMNGPNESVHAVPTGLVSTIYNNFTLILLGPAPVEDFQATLLTLTYINTAEEPVAGQRLIELIASDGGFFSAPKYITIVIHLINDAPVIDLNGRIESDIDFMLEYEEGSGAVPIVSTTDLIIYDHDHRFLTQAMVVIQHPYDAPNEILSVNNTLFPNITISYNTTTGSLVLFGTATVQDYQELLRTVMYENTVADPGRPSTLMRVIIFTIFDGERYNDPPAETLLMFTSVNDPPILDLNGDSPGRNNTVQFTEEGEPVPLTNENMTLVDIDSELLSEARVTITNCLDRQNETLSSFLNSDSGNLMPLQESYERSSCTLVINGTATVEEYRDVLTSVTYQNTADEPVYTSRSIRFTVRDSDLYSVAHYTTVDIIPVNDPPRLQVAAPMGMFAFGDNINLFPGTTPTTGSEQTPASGMGLDGSGVSGSGDMLGPFSGDRPTTNTGTDTTNVTPTITPVNISMANITQAEFQVLYVENEPAVSIVQTSFVKVEDDDDMEIARIQVTIQNEMDPGYEAVFFKESDLDSIPDLKFALAPYVSSSCPIGGTHNTHIDLSRTLELEQMEVAVKSLHYCNSDEDPTPGNRTITFRIQDPHEAWSDIQTTVVLVMEVNDVPIYSPPDTFETLYEISEDTNISISVLGNFFDHEETLNGSAIRIVTQPKNGTATVDELIGAVIFSPLKDDHGTYQIFYQACDSQGGCSPPQNLTIIIRPVNDPPYPANNLVLVVNEDATVRVDLTQFFGDVEDDLIPGNPFPRVDKLIPGSLSVTLEENGTMADVTPFSNFHGNDSLTLIVCDSSMSCINISLTLMIHSINDPPFILINYPGNASRAVIQEDTTLNISITIADVESKTSTPLTLGVLSVGNGTAVASNTSDAVLTIIPQTQMGDLEPYRNRLRQDMYIIYTPNKNFYGEDVVRVFANDTEGGYTEHVVLIRVLYVNDPPEFGITHFMTGEDQPLVLHLPQDVGATDPEDILHAGSFSIANQPQYGNLSYSFNSTHLDSTGMFPDMGTLVYTPELNFNGTDQFTIMACDNDTVTTILCTSQMITVSVQPFNDAPHVPPFNVSGDEEHTITFNLWERTYDIEEGRPPIDGIQIIRPLPQHGFANYNNRTGVLTYSPFVNFFGEDNLFFEACDSHGSCNSSGHVLILVLNVNDPPVAQDFTVSTREDDFDLIDIFGNSNDNESADIDLKIAIVNTTSQTYVQRFTTTIGGSLRVYQAHGVITYEPPPNYVGPDRFVYSVCDRCDPRRDEELGRVDQDPECSKQLRESGNSIVKPGGRVYITCDEAIVTLQVINENDVPTVRDIHGITDQGKVVMLTPFEDAVVRNPLPSVPYLYMNSSAVVFDYDDLQSFQVQTEGLNLTTYNLADTTNIDELSLRIRSIVPHGTAEIENVNGMPRISYTPNPGFSGYEEFRFQICDLKLDNEPPRCSEATARVFVTKPGPGIARIQAFGNKENSIDTDSKVSRGDQVLIQFREDTNMPPHGNTNNILSADDIDRLLEFPDGFIPPSLVQNRYQGRWQSRKDLVITVIDEGYPQPESKIGNWTVAVKPNSGRCGGFDTNGQRLSQVDDYCLLSADGNSLHSTATSPTLSGDWGLHLPQLSSVLIRNIAVQDDTQESNQGSLIFPKTQISLNLQEPFSYHQLMLYCEQNAEDILFPGSLGVGVQMIVVGCANLLKNGQDANMVYESQIEDTRSYFSSLASTSGRNKRATATTELPLASEVVLQIQSYLNLTTNPRENPSQFVSNVREGLNISTIAFVVNQLLGVNITVLENFTKNLPLDTRRQVSFYPEHDDNLTPEVIRVEANDPNCNDGYSVGDTITIEFDRDTDQPLVTTKSDIDKIFVFNPPLGTGYNGEWTSPSMLMLTITSVDGQQPLPSNNNFSLSFRNNYLENGVEFTANVTTIPTDRRQCIGVNVCGSTSGAVTIGVCSVNRLSCRAYEPVLSIEGDFSGGSSCRQTPPIDWVWVLVAIIALLLIFAVILLIYFCYRQYSHKKQREEALRVVKRWEKDHHYSPRKQEEKQEMPKPWSKPPDIYAMRDVPDPFAESKDDKDPLKNLPEVARPPTAAPAEGLPPIQAVPESFKPRAGARIQPALPLLHTLPAPGTIRSSVTTSPLPSLTPLVSLLTRYG